MQQAIPYKSWTPLYTTNSASSCSITHNHNKNTIIKSSVLPPNCIIGLDSISSGDERLMMVNLVSENAVIVFAKKGCCMGHVVRRLLLGLGVNPAVYEVDDKDEVGVVKELEMIIDGEKEGNLQFPAVFIGGRLFGGLDKVMSTHISGELVPVLKQAGALWL